MSVRRVLVLESQTPFVHGGAEILCQLIAALREGGCEAALVSVPFRESPREELMAHTVGRVSDQELVSLYALARAMLFMPSDYGYVTLEAFLSRRPVITTTDAGGPTEFVTDGVNGPVVEPSPRAIGAAAARVAFDAALAERLETAGFERARAITRAGVVERLVAGR